MQDKCPGGKSEFFFVLADDKYKNNGIMMISVFVRVKRRGERRFARRWRAVCSGLRMRFLHCELSAPRCALGYVPCVLSEYSSYAHAHVSIFLAVRASVLSTVRVLSYAPRAPCARIYSTVNARHHVRIYHALCAY